VGAQQPITDIVVAGGGMAGLAAGLRAQELGASVAILEAAEEAGGSAAMAGGILRTFGTPEAFRDRNPSGEPAVARAIVENFDRAVGILTRLDIAMDVDACRVAGRNGEDGCCRPDSIYTRHYRLLNSRATMTRMAGAFCAGGGRLMTGTRLQRLLVEDGRVSGVVAASPSGALSLKSESVILATGGFQGNTELLARYMGPWSGLMPLRSNLKSRGDGLLAGLEQGAATSCGLHAFYGHLMPAPPAVVTRANFLATTARYSLLSVLVNLAGRRFVDESISDDESARAAVRQEKAAVFAIFDAEGDRQRVLIDPSRLDRFNPAIEAGARAARSDTLEELVEELAAWGVRPASLSRTLAGFNCSMDTGDDRELDAPRARYRLPLKNPPFFGIALVAAITFTFGGLRVDQRCRVMDRHDSPISGLYAAGVDAGGAYVETYGGGLAMALALGYVAGEQAAHAARRE